MTQRDLDRANRMRGMGRPKPSPATAFVMDILEDLEWHSIDELVDTLLASGVPIRRSDRMPRREAALVVIREIAKKNAYEAQMKHVGTRSFYKAVRRNPIRLPGAKLMSCSECGRPDLDVATRVRRTQEYRIPKPGARGQGDLCAARFKSTYLCIPCAEVELEARGVEWKIQPPFMPSGSYSEEKKEELDVQAQ